MRIKLLFLSVLINLLGYAQPAQNIKIDWQNSIDNNLSPFVGASHFKGHPIVPAVIGTLLINANTRYKLIVSNIQTTAITVLEQAILKDFEVSKTPLMEYGVAEFKGKQILSYSILPYVIRNGAVQKITGCKISAVAIGAEQGLNKTYATTFTTNSVLSSGDWYKLSVKETNMHKITPGLLTEAGAGSNLAISGIRIVGNGTGILPERNSLPRPDDLLDVAYQAFDQNSDGIFNGSDFLVFYAKGPHQWQLSTSDSLFRHTQNFYRDENYYFISANAGSGKLVAQANAITQSTTESFTTYDDYQSFEKEETNLVATGRIWVGDVFDFTKNRNYSFAFTDVVQTQPVILRVNLVGRASTSNTNMEVSYNGVQVLNANIPQYSTFGDYPNFVERIDNEVTFTPASPNNISINLNYNNAANPTGVAWLDFLEIQLKRNLIFRNKTLQFRNKTGIKSNAIAEYTISNASASLNIWDITDYTNPKRIVTQSNGSTVLFKDEHNALKQYVAFAGSDFLLPESKGKVANQNLHALQDVDMVIVTHRNFMDASKELAAFHEDNENLTVAVVDVSAIYNEFSSGGLDITAIRDFARMLYERSSTNNGKFKYLMLMGDASYDYRDRIANNDNYVPIWESPASFSLGFSNISDDYYALLDPSEGNSLNNAFLDIGVGRVPARFGSEATAYVKKVKAYSNSQKRFGDWRNKILLIADDMDASAAWEDIFVFGSQDLERRVNKFSSAFNIDKIYSDAYKQVSTTGRQTYPEATRDIFRKVQQGNLVTNYIGHGGEIGLASEGLIGLDEVKSWTNLDNMPLFITITCEFTRVDDPKRVSAGEQLLLNPVGGAISLISTTRVVGAQTGINLNKSIFDTLLSRPNNLPLTFGDIILAAKNGQVSNGDKAKFSLFGDPALRLAIPVYNVQTNTLNGVDINSPSLDTISAQKTITITGQVNDLSNQKFNTFNGVLDVSVFDKPSDKKTLLNDGNGIPLAFKLQNNLIYRGKVTVANGDFSFKFIVPIDISYRFGKGKISYYANNGTIDAAGSNDSVVVGGFSNAASSDKEGPEVALFMNDESFVRGGITGSNSDLYAIISDSSGVNTVGNSVGHDLVAILDGKTDQSFVLNEYYEADLDSYQSGKVRYPFFDLETGEHQLQLKVFDVFNNFSISETDFIVAEDENLVLRQVLNYPNPFTTYTEFQFEHNRANLPLEVQVQVFTVSGQLVKTINTAVTPTGNRVTGIAWNGLDDYGDLIGKGVYVYRVKVNSPTDNSIAEEYEKLVILR